MNKGQQSKLLYGVGHTDHEQLGLFRRPALSLEQIRRSEAERYFAEWERLERLRHDRARREAILDWAQKELGGPFG